VKSPEWQNVPELIYRVAHGLFLEQIALRVEIEDLFVYADPLLQKVFHNLIDNATRYGDTITWIRFFGNENPEGYILVCEDNGVGIPDQYKEGIFRREYYKHTGFGLNLSREILDITGMSIRETGESGRGARFEISIPRGGYRFSA
jgi:K+-sensing histidine kinase KdpD